MHISTSIFSDFIPNLYLNPVVYAINLTYFV